MSAVVLAATSSVHATLLSYDSFSYTPSGASLTGQSGGTGFGGAYTANGAGLTTSATGVTYTDSASNTLVTAGGQANLSGGNAGAFRALSATYGGTGTVYLSFLEQVNTTNGYAGVSLFTGTGSEHVFIGAPGGSSSPAINLESGGPATAVGGSPLTNVSLLVAKLTFSTTTGVSVSLYDNPVLGTEPATPYLTLTNPTDFTFDTFRIQSGSDAGLIDEVRIGDTYASVTPIATPTPEPSAWMASACLAGFAGLRNRRRVRA